MGRGKVSRTRRRLGAGRGGMEGGGHEPHLPQRPAHLVMRPAAELVGSYFGEREENQHAMDWNERRSGPRGGRDAAMSSGINRHRCNLLEKKTWTVSNRIMPILRTLTNCQGFLVLATSSGFTRTGSPLKYIHTRMEYQHLGPHSESRENQGPVAEPETQKHSKT